VKKEFKGKLCAYCNVRRATTDDHVIGKKFFPQPLRGNLPKVPACKECNNKKGDLERYAMAVFPFGSSHPAGEEMLRTKVEARLKKDQRLHRQLRQGQRDVPVVNPNGTTETRFAIPLDDEKALTLFAMIIKGLLWHHCQSPLPSAYVVRLFSFTDVGIGLFRQHILSLSQEQFQMIVLAEGAFQYEFTRNTQDPFFSVWVLNIYGLLSMCDITADGQLLRCHVAALTGPAEEINPLADAIEKKAL